MQQADQSPAPAHEWRALRHVHRGNRSHRSGGANRSRRVAGRRRCLGHDTGDRRLAIRPLGALPLPRRLGSRSDRHVPARHARAATVVDRKRPMAPLIKRVHKRNSPQGTVPESCLSNGIETCHAFMRFREALLLCIVWDTFCR